MSSANQVSLTENCPQYHTLFNSLHFYNALTRCSTLWHVSIQTICKQNRHIKCELLFSRVLVTHVYALEWHRTTMAGVNPNKIFTRRCKFYLCTYFSVKKFRTMCVMVNDFRYQREKNEAMPSDKVEKCKRADMRLPMVY